MNETDILTGNQCHYSLISHVLEYVCVGVSRGKEPCSSPPLGQTVPCRDMGTPINVLRARGISILEAAE